MRRRLVFNPVSRSASLLATACACSIGALLIAWATGAEVSAQQTPATSNAGSGQFVFRTDAPASLLLDDVGVPNTLVCEVDATYIGAWMSATTAIYSPTMRLLASHGSSGPWNSIHHEGSEPVDEWSRPGQYRCVATWSAWTSPGGSLIEQQGDDRLFVNVVNSNCACMSGEQNRAITRTSSISINWNDPGVDWFIQDSMAAGSQYWNDMLDVSGSPVRVNSGGAIPVWITPIAASMVAAQYTNVGGPERIEVDPEFFSWGWDPVVWDHLITHEIGHALGFKHGSCGQLTTVMYSPVNVPNQGSSGNPSNYISRFSAGTNTDRCSVYSEYRP